MGKKPRWKPDERQVKEMAMMAGYGSPLHEIAAIMGVCKETLEDALKRDSALRCALEKGRASTNRQVGLSLFRQAVGERHEIKDENGNIIDVKYVREPNVAAAIFWAKTRMRWRETAPEIEEGQTQRVVVIIPENGRETKK
jgi:hypothetical protein